MYISKPITWIEIAYKTSTSHPIPFWATTTAYNQKRDITLATLTLRCYTARLLQYRSCGHAVLCWRDKRWDEEDSPQHSTSFVTESNSGAALDQQPWRWWTETRGAERLSRTLASAPQHWDYLSLKCCVSLESSSRPRDPPRSTKKKKNLFSKTTASPLPRPPSKGTRRVGFSYGNDVEAS